MRGMLCWWISNVFMANSSANVRSRFSFDIDQSMSRVDATHQRQKKRQRTSLSPTLTTASSSCDGDRPQDRTAILTSPALVPVVTNASKLDDLPFAQNDGQFQTFLKMKPEDQGLQVLLWTFGYHYMLHSHQFQGVRAIAGVTDDFGKTYTVRSARRREEFGRGLLVADAMGLGKTIQAVAACIIRNKIANFEGLPRKPTLIVLPNESVLHQWVETLVKAGVQKDVIFRLKTKMSAPIRECEIYILCTRYDLLTEARYSFDCCDDGRNGSTNTEFRKSALFPNASEDLMKFLYNQYCSIKGKEKNEYLVPDLSMTELIAKKIGDAEKDVEKVFRTVIIDEAHFLRNLLTFWGFAACLIGIHADRIVPMTGTPFNNGIQDLATLCTFFQPNTPFSRVGWWRDATKDGAVGSVKQITKQWTALSLLRRGKNVISHLLPKKTLAKEQIDFPEFGSREYIEYEKKFLSLLKQLNMLKQAAQNGSPSSRRKYKMCFEMSMSVACCMRSSLVHPVLPRGGRDLSVLFSPTRRKMKSVLRCCEKKVCVSCTLKPKTNNKDDKDNGFDEPEPFYEEGGVEEDNIRYCKSDSDGSQLVPIPAGSCYVLEYGIRHFVCRKCYDALCRSKKTCPKCADLFPRLRDRSKKSSVGPLVASNSYSRRIYGKNLFHGFQASKKLQKIIEDFKELAYGTEKVLICSFFKGTLDLIEAMFAEVYPTICYARFDADVKKSERSVILENFQRNEKIRVLFMTVQTGGVGLNLVEANHVWFIDRFWNPMVMEQCEDRCYRIGQKKNVSVRYFDVRDSIDDVMASINETKKSNAAVVLPDGTDLGSAGMSYEDLTGKLYEAVENCLTKRKQHEEKKHATDQRQQQPSRSPSLYHTLGTRTRSESLQTSQSTSFHPRDINIFSIKKYSVKLDGSDDEIDDEELIGDILRKAGQKAPLRAGSSSKKGSKKKDPYAPKKGWNAFMIFRNENLPRLKKMNPKAPYHEMTAIVNMAFRNQTEEEWNKLRLKAKKEKERYEAEMAQYTKQQAQQKKNRNTSKSV